MPNKTQYKEIRLLRSSIAISALTLVSRILGMVREILIAYFFGASIATDAFFVANRIPNLLRRIFAEGAFTQAFIPLLTEYRNEKSPQEVVKFISHTAGLLIVSLLVLILLVEIAAPIVTVVFAPGFVFDANKLEIATAMLRITFPYILFISLITLAAGIFNSYGRFVVPAITSALLNISFIASITLLSQYLSQPYMSLAWAVMIAGIVQLAFQVPFLLKLNLLVMPKLNWHDSKIRRMLKLMLPSVFGASIVQINLMIDNILASFLTTGSISWLSYSIHLIELPVALFGIAIATVLLPYLSNTTTRKQKDKSVEAIDWALRMVLILGLPSTIALVVLATPIVTTLFQYGSLNAHDVFMSSASLQAYALGLLFIMLMRIIVPIYFAHQDTKTPVKFAFVAMLTNIVLNLALIYWLAHVGIALATSIAALVQTALLMIYICRFDWYKFSKKWPMFLAKVLMANLMLLAFLLLVKQTPQFWLAQDIIHRVTYLSLICGAGIASYFILLISLRVNLHKVAG